VKRYVDKDCTPAFEAGKSVVEQHYVHEDSAPLLKRRHRLACREVNS
jgi:hypothetical protein